VDRGGARAGCDRRWGCAGRWSRWCGRGGVERAARDQLCRAPGCTERADRGRHGRCRRRCGGPGGDSHDYRTDDGVTDDGSTGNNRVLDNDAVDHNIVDRGTADNHVVDNRTRDGTHRRFQENTSGAPRSAQSRVGLQQ